MDSIENFLTQFISQEYEISISESKIGRIITLFKENKDIKEYLSVIVDLSKVEEIYLFFNDCRNVILYDSSNLSRFIKSKCIKNNVVNFKETLTETDLMNIDALLSYNDKIKILAILKNEKGYGINLDNLLYGSKLKFLYFIRTYKELFYYFFMYLTTVDKKNKKNILKQLERLDGSIVFINFLQNGTDYSTENCKMINFEDVKFYDSYEKTRKDYSLVNEGEHSYNLDIEVPEEFIKLFGDDFKLNEVQKSVFNVAFFSSDNFLVCAPTGCGKTIIAAMSIFSLIQKKKNIRIAYIAPMKALVNEIAQYFAYIFKKLSLCVVEATTDIEVSLKNIEKANIIVGTPEKIDIILRKTFISFDLFVVDEIHILNETRGCIVEGLISRIKTRYKSRIVAMSATLSNYMDVGMFIGATVYNIFNFDNSFRPCPLEYEIIHTSNLDLELADKLNQEEGPFLVFTNTKVNTIRTAEYLKSYYEENEMEGFDYDVFIDPKIKELAKFGIGVHHAGLSKDTRINIENAFRNGFLKILISTSTLAWGVNLPVKTVIIKGSKFYNAEIGEYTELSNMNILQMFGRAGRLKQRGSCKGILISEDISNFYFEQSIESHILPNICNLLLAEIVLGIASFKEALEWFKNTFYHVRLTKISKEAFRISKDIVFSALKTLDGGNLIKYGDRIHPTHLGKICVKYFVDYRDIGYLNNILRQEMMDSDIIDGISQVKEFRNLKYSLDIDNFPIPTRTDFGKLIQLYIIDYKDFENDEYLNTIYVLDQNLERIFQCVFEISLYKNLYVSKQILEFIKSMRYKFFMYQTPLRHFVKQENKLKSIEAKNIPFSILRKLDRKDFEELNIEGYDFLKYFPNFGLKFSIYFEDENLFFINLEIERECTFSKTENHKYHLFVSNPSEPEVLIYELLYLDKNTEYFSFTYNIKKAVLLEFCIVSDEYIGVSNTITVDVRDFYKDKKLLEETFNGFQIMDVFSLDIRDDVLVTRTTKDKLCLERCGYNSITYNEFLEEFNKFKSITVLDVHDSSYRYSVKKIIEICKKNNINFTLAGLQPKHRMDNFVAGSYKGRLNVYTSYFSTFYSRLYDLIRMLNLHNTRNKNKRTLIILPTRQIYEICRNSLRYLDVFQCDGQDQTEFTLYCDLNPLSSIDKKNIFDYVLILDTQYFDYSSKQYVNYKLSDLLYMSYLGEICNLYISYSKRDLYLTNGSLGVLYDHFENKCYDDIFIEGIRDLGLSPSSIEILDKHLKNNMGMKNLASLVCQLDEYHREITEPNFKNLKNVEFGINYIIIDSILSNRLLNEKLKIEFYRTTMKDLKHTLLFMIQISSKKMFLKTMFNIVFLLQNLFKGFVKKSFVEIIKEAEDDFIIVNDLPDLEGNFVTFYFFYDDSTFTVMHIFKKGRYKINKKNLSCYVLSDCWSGYKMI